MYLLALTVAPFHEMILLLFVSLLTWCLANDISHLHCRDPDIGAHHYKHNSERTFLIIGGNGAGIGNFLVFYAAAYYFAVLTGRDILIQDGSLIGELCDIVHCAFPLYNQVAVAFPNLVDISKVRGIKAFDFGRHLYGEVLITDRIVRADGYKYMSGWYMTHNYSDYCISKLTRCPIYDRSCHDRHALQQLVKGPFLEKNQHPEMMGHRIVGVPDNLKQGILSLPHALAPRLDAAVHLRCQFRHFEYLVGPEDNLWQNYVKEVNDWMDSTEPNAGIALFRTVEQKIMSEVEYIKKKRDKAEARRLSIVRQLEKLEDALPHINLTLIDQKVAHSTYTGDSDTIYVYLASDNERVKEAFAQYLVGHANISVMRVWQPGHTVHAKNINYLKESKGVFPLVMDWYALTLANTVFAWRRDTDLLSTFAQSARMVSGSQALNEGPLGMLDGEKENSKGFQLRFRHGNLIWSEF